MVKKVYQLGLNITLLALLAGTSQAQDTAVATHVPKSEIMAAYQGMTSLPDQQVRVVDIGDDINVAVGILRREATHTDEGEPVTALAHHDVTEVYYVVSGSGILVSGG